MKFNYLIFSLFPAYVQMDFKKYILDNYINIEIIGFNKFFKNFLDIYSEF